MRRAVGPLQSRLFVYGTLRSSANHPLGSLLRRQATLVGEGHIRARLYIIRDPFDGSNAYPGAVPSGDPADLVRGEVYGLKADAAKLFATLDEFENCSPAWPEPHEFVRRRVPVEMAEGDAIEAIAYLYTWDVSRAEYLPSGNFTLDGSKVR